MDTKQYIQSLELQDPVMAFPAPRITRSQNSNMPKTADNEQSFLADKTIVSFAAGVSQQSRKDVLNCTLVAQMVANKKYSSEDKDAINWYKEYVNVLSNLGWVLEGGDVNTYEAKGSILKVENVVIDILVSAFGNSFIGLITKTLNALKTPKESKKLIAFEANSMPLQKSCFQLAAAVEKNDTVMLQVGTFLLTSSTKMKHILFFEFAQDKTKLEYINRRATLNIESFAKNRKDVLALIQNKVGDYISEIDLYSH